MIIGFLIIIIFPFIFFFTQVNNLGKKTSVIKKAMDEGRETYIDPIDHRMHLTENGALVTRTKLISIWKPGDQDSLPGDEVILGLKNNKVYRNYSREKFVAHVQEQIDQGKCWCGERKEYRDKGCSKDHLMKFHMKEKYFYRLDTHETREAIYNEKGRYIGKNKLTIYCYKEIYNLSTKKYGEKKEIGYEEYKELGGEYNAQDFIVRHMA